MFRLRRRPAQPEPLFRGDFVTVCIAAKCPQLNRIVFVADTMVSSDTISTDKVMKMRHLGNAARWFALFAGPERRFVPLVERIHKELGDSPGATVHEVIEAAQKAWHASHVELVEREVLGQLDISLDDCVHNGLQWFGERRHGAMLETIEELESHPSFAIDLLIAGFDAENEQHMFELSYSGRIARHANLLFHAVGAGRSAALSALYPQPLFSRGTNLNEIIYRMCAAKFAAESAPSVGRDTVVVVVSPDRQVFHMLFNDVIDKLRVLWKEKGQPPVPEGADSLIDEQLRKPLRRFDE